MAYDLEKMNSLGSLEKILLVLNDVRDKSETKGLSSIIVLRDDRFLDNVPKEDYENIISSLLEIGVLKDKKVVGYELVKRDDWEDIKETWDAYNIKIDYEKFNKFSEELINRIKELKGEKPKSNRLEFDLDKALLYINDAEIKVQKFSDQYHLLRIVFEDKKDLLKE